MKDCTIYVVRHGQTTHNRDNIVSGHVDPELTSLGISQANNAAVRLCGVEFHEVYTSDLGRAVRTAEIIYGSPVPKEHRLKGLRERNFGKLDGGPEKYLGTLADSLRHIFNSLPNDEQWKFKHAPDIESDHELSTRFTATLKEIADNNLAKTVLVVAHGGTLRTMIMKLQGLLTNAYPKGSIKNTAIVKLKYDGMFLTVEDILN